MDKDKKELMLKRAEEMILRGKKIEDTLDLLKKQIDLLQKDKEDYKKDYINAKQEVYKDEVIERLNKEIAKTPNDKELIARRNELIKSQQEMIQSAMSEKQAMIDLVRDGYDLQLDSLQDLKIKIVGNKK